MSLTFKEYSDFARLSDLYPRVTGIDGQILPVYPALALMGEVGELADKLLGPPVAQIDYLNEIGDVLWYTDAAARDLGLELEQVSGYPRFGTWQQCVSHPDVSLGVIRYGLALTAIASKFSEPVKKGWRDQKELNPSMCAMNLQHIMCTLHQVSMCVYGTLEQAARANMAKLESRRARGVVSGSGDNR